MLVYIGIISLGMEIEIDSIGNSVAADVAVSTIVYAIGNRKKKMCKSHMAETKNQSHPQNNPLTYEKGFCAHRAV